MIREFNYFFFLFLSIFPLFYTKIIHANSSNLYTLLQQQSYSVIFIFDNLNDETIRAQRVFEKLDKGSHKNKDLQFISLNIKTNNTIIEEWDIDNLPTIIFYRRLGEEITKMKEEITKENTKLLLYLFLDDYDDESQKIKDLNFTYQLNSRNYTKYKNLLIFVGDRNKYNNQFLITKRLVFLLGEKYQMIVSNSSKIFSHYNVSNNDFGLILIKNQKKIKESPAIVNKLNLSYLEKFNIMSLKRFIKSYEFKPFMKLNDGILEKIFSANYKFLLIVFHSGYNTSAYENNLKEFAESHRKDFFIITCEMGDKKIKEIFKYIEITSFPGVVFFSGINRKTATIYKYILEGSLELSKSEEQLENFYRDFRHKKLKNHLQSENLPTELINEFNVFKLVTKNFDLFIKSNNFSVIFFVNDKMINSKQKKQRFYLLALKLKNISLIKFGEINPYYNEIDLIDMKHYPGIAIFSNNKNIPPLEFNSKSFKSLEIINFIEKYSQVKNISKVFHLDDINSLKEETDIKYDEPDTDEENDEIEKDNHEEIHNNQHDDL